MPQIAISNHRRWPIRLFLIIVAVGWIVFYMFTLPVGDDLNYNTVFSDYRGIGNGIYETSATGIKNYWHDHCSMVNGRLANLFFVLSVNFLPKWLVAVLSGLMVAVFIGLVLKAAGVLRARNAGVTAFAIIAFISLFFPWYDYFDILCVNYNYVWGAVAQICAVLLIFNRPRKTSWIYVLLSMVCCYVAGSFHEAASTALCVGMLFVVVMQRRQGGQISPLMAILMFSYFVGTAIVSLAPGILRRLVSSIRTPDSDPLTLVMVSAPLVLLMIAIYTISAITPKGRERLHKQMSSENAVWSVAAIAGLPAIAAGGIIGRSGFFVETYALIAIIQYWQPWKRYHVKRGTAIATCIVLMLVVVSQLTGLCILRYSSYKAGTEIFVHYKESPTGIVYYDQPDDNSLPFWAWSRIRNLHIEDAFTVNALKRYYKKENRLTLLPLSAKGVDIENVASTDTIVLKDKEMIVGTLPLDAVMPDSSIWTKPIVGISADGMRIIEPIHREGHPDIYYIGPRAQLFGE